ncbi:MAG TPA: VOC family protein [Alphaproteobacteria bacterium]|jgi:catechol 2,3-dioxygenase
MDHHAKTEAQRTQAAADQPRHPDRYVGTSPIQVNKLGHLVYEVSDMERSVRFWTEVMGFHETDRNEIGMVFFRCGVDHHAIGLKPTKTKTARNMESGLQVEHLALEIANTEMLVKARDYLKANGIPIVFEGRKGAGCNYAVNFLDPDGYEFEIYCSMDQIEATGRLRPKTQFIRANNLEDALANPVPTVW